MTPRRPPEAGRAIRVVTWPDWSRQNPYQRLFYRALEPHGIRLVPGMDANAREIVAHRPAIDFVHLHWPYAYWRSRGKTTVRQTRAVVRFWSMLRTLRSAGVQVLWTVHDLEHLEGDRFPDRLGNKILYRRTDLVIHHTEWSAAKAEERFGPPGGDVLVMPHGNYEGATPVPRPRDVTLRRYDVPEGRRVLLCFGKIRPYKGFEVAVEALRHLPTERYHLIVAGEARAHERLVARAAEGLSNVTIVAETVTDDVAADLMGAADCVLLPYARATGSGVLAMALTHERGIVASDLPAFREAVAGHPHAAVLVPDIGPRTLAAGVEEFFETSSESRAADLRSLAGSLDWNGLVGPVAAWMRAAVSAR